MHHLVRQLVSKRLPGTERAADYPPDAPDQLLAREADVHRFAAKVNRLQ